MNCIFIFTWKHSVVETDFPFPTVFLRKQNSFFPSHNTKALSEQCKDLQSNTGLIYFVL